MLIPEMKKREVIVGVGTSGSTIALYGTRTDRGWIFERDGTPDLLGEEPIHTNSRGVENWDAALRLLDRYRWPRLIPSRGRRGMERFGKERGGGWEIC